MWISAKEYNENMKDLEDICEKKVDIAEKEKNFYKSISEEYRVKIELALKELEKNACGSISDLKNRVKAKLEG